jgi:hypothetical protein
MAWAGAVSQSLILVSNRATGVGCQAVPRGVTMPLVFSSTAILRTLVRPLALMLSITERRVVARS